VFRRPGGTPRINRLKTLTPLVLLALCAGSGSDDRELARQKGQASAAIRATELVGVELGMFINRSDNKHSFEKRFSQLPPEEQRTVAADVLRRAREAIERQKVIEVEAQEVSGDAGE
jgi:hypothetical protein